MHDLIVSVNKGALKLSTIDKNGQLKTFTCQLSAEVVDDSVILDSTAFAKILGESLSQLDSTLKNKLATNFVVEPQDVILNYVVISKNKGEEDTDAQILKEVKEKLEGVALEDLYFSYQKIAPFLYQFVGVKKEFLEKYLEVSNILGLSLKSIIPWVLLLPKYVAENKPSIFVCRVDGTQVVALSELNGVFYSNVYKKDRTSKELEDFIKDLSFYKRSSPIDKVYTLNYDSFSLSDYEIRQIELPSFSNVVNGGVEGFEINILTNYMLDTKETLLSSQLNLLNLLPLPVAKKTSALVYAGGAISVLVLFAGIYGFMLLQKNKSVDNTQLAQANNQQQVLSAEETNESTSSNEEKKDLKREDLTIRIENGSGITGLAGRTQDYLKGKGYKIDSIDTANSEVESTVLQFKKGKTDYKDLISTDLKEKFPNIVIKEDLAEDSKYDLLITAGKDSKM